jgi:WD40 repeat protein
MLGDLVGTYVPTQAILQTPFDAAVVIPTILRPSLWRAVESIFRQRFAWRIQILIGIDKPVGDRAVLDEICRECTAHCVVSILELGYSTSIRHGGLYPARDGGVLRTILSYAAHSRYVAYLDDDNWWAENHLASLLEAVQGHDWAYSWRWFVDPDTPRPLCIDTWESVGSDAGIFREKFGGFVDPNTLLLDKLACEPVLRWWSIPLPDDAVGMSADRQVFRLLRTQYRGRATGQATCYYRMDPKDGMQPLRQRMMRQQAEKGNKDGYRELVRLFEGHTGPIRRMAVSPDGRLLLSAGGWPYGDGTARLWDIHTGKELLCLKEELQPDAVMGPQERPGEVQTVAFAPDGRRALTGGSNNVLHLWDLQTGELLRRLHGHGGTIYNVVFAADGLHAASSSLDGTIRLWDQQTGKEVQRLEGHNNWVLAIGYSLDGKRLLSRGMDNTMRLWEVESGKELKRLENMGGGIPGLVWFPDGRRVLSAQGAILQILDIETGEELRRIQAHPFGTTSVALSPDGRRALSSGYGGSVRLWDVETGRELRHLSGHRNGVMSVVFTPDGHHALTAGGGVVGPDGPRAGEDFAIRLWELPHHSSPAEI